MRNKIHVKVGDTVQIISGKYKGIISKITKVLPKKRQVIIKDVNMKTKHSRPNQESKAGQTIRFEAPIHSSNVMLYSEKYKKRSRYCIQINNNNQKKRVLKKTQEIIN